MSQFINAIRDVIALQAKVDAIREGGEGNVFDAKDEVEEAIDRLDTQLTAYENHHS